MYNAQLFEDFATCFLIFASSSRCCVTLELLKFIQRYIENDLDIIVASDTHFFDKLFQNSLTPFKTSVLIHPSADDPEGSCEP